MPPFYQNAAKLIACMVIGTFEWSSFRIIRKVPRSDALILVMVSTVTVVTGLAIAVIVGVIVSALVFAWKHAKHILVEARDDHKGSTVYAVTGPLFFGSITSFLGKLFIARRLNAGNCQYFKFKLSSSNNAAMGK
ncbi:MAG: hypothetical protein V3T17_18710, partial [Pseudomonadales bacterium]